MTCLSENAAGSVSPELWVHSVSGSDANGSAVYAKCSTPIANTIWRAVSSSVPPTVTWNNPPSLVTEVTRASSTGSESCSLNQRP